MEPVVINDNEFLRQFETTVNGNLARIEYASQERKIFLTKLVLPEELNEPEFKEAFLDAVMRHIQSKGLFVVPTSPPIAGFLRKHKEYHDLLPVGIRI